MAGSRVDLTPAAADLIRRLRGVHGPLMFHQSGGCCDGSSPMCFPAGEFRLGEVDVHLGDLHVDDEPVQVWMSESQFAYWRHTHLTIDVVPGRGSGFSVEAPEGVRFLIRSRLLTDEEVAELHPCPEGGLADVERPEGPLRDTSTAPSPATPNPQAPPSRRKPP